MAEQDPSAMENLKAGDHPEAQDKDNIQSDERATESSDDQKAKEKNKKIAKGLKGQKESSKRNRRQFYNEWKRSVELRLGKIASQYTGGVNVEDEVQTEVNPDWSLTKTKVANLFSQVPMVSMTHQNSQFAQAIPPFMKSVNYEISENRCDLAVPMEEVLNDVTNASGVGGIYVSYDAIFEDVEMPAIDVSRLPKAMVDIGIKMKLIPTTTKPMPVDAKISTERISPTNLLWPTEFLGSDFNKGPWAGYSGSYTWAQGQNELDLDDDDKERVMKGSESEVKTEDDLRSQPDKGGLLDVKKMHFDHLFYKRHLYDSDCAFFDEIWEIVWVDGIDEPVRHRQWTGQKFLEDTGKFVGNKIFPLQILTTTYVTDNPIPPSESSAMRPQVNDMRRSRSQMFQNRERSLPLRWANSDKMDPEVMDTVMRGDFQGIIPVQGDGSRIMGEVARATYPSEDFTFDQMNKADLIEGWGFGPAQLGIVPNKQNRAQVQSEAQNFATRIGVERNKVAKFFLNIVRLVSGYMILYSDFPILTPQEKQIMQQTWDQGHIQHDLVLKIRPDSQVVLDTTARIKRISDFINLTGKSGFVNVQPLITELAELSTIDPNGVVITPQPKQPEEPNISYRFSSKDDLMSAMVMALLVKHGKAPNEQEIQKAQQLLQLASQIQQPGSPAQAPGPQQGQPPAGPAGPHPPGPAGPPPNPEQPAGANSNWSTMSKVAKRSRDMASIGEGEK